MTDESNIGLWFLLACVLLTLTPWIAFDAWLKANHHEYITTEVRELLAAGGWQALLVVALVGAVLGVGYFHFFWQR